MKKAGLDASAASKAQAELKGLGVKYRAALQGFDAADPEAGKKVDLSVRGMDRDLATAMENLDKALAAHAVEQTEHFRTEAAAIMHSAEWLTVVGIVIVLVALAGLGWLLLRSIMESVSGLQSTMLQPVSRVDFWVASHMPV